MIKSLYLMRHAKSDWTEGVKDFDRTLAERGLNDTPKMASRLIKLGLQPDLIVSSPAKRALFTAEIICKSISYPKNILLEPTIYEASVADLFKVINSLSDEYNSVMIFGHNPSISLFAESLTFFDIGEFPTAACIRIDFIIDSWKEVSGGLGEIVWFIYPNDSV